MLATAPDLLSHMRSFLIVAMTLSAALMPAAAIAGNKQDMLDAIKRYAGSTSAQSAAAGLTQGDLVAGLKQALAQGTQTAISQLGRSDGFWKDAATRIPLPASIARFESPIRALGYGSKLDKFHLTLNRAAEQAVPQVAEIFAGSITQMTVADAQSILTGPKDAATQFFRRTSSAQLIERILPIVQSSTASVGVTQKYKALVDKAGPVMRLSGSQSPDLDAYVTQKTVDGLFLKIADEEARIRDNPAARGTELLKKVFGRQ